MQNGLEIVCEIVMYRYVPMSHMISVYRCYIYHMVIVYDMDT